MRLSISSMIGFAVVGKASSHGVSMPTFCTPWPDRQSVTCSSSWVLQIEKCRYQGRISQFVVEKLSKIDGVHHCDIQMIAIDVQRE
jgi:hypothetical protein